MPALHERQDENLKKTAVAVPFETPIEQVDILSLQYPAYQKRIMRARAAGYSDEQIAPRLQEREAEALLYYPIHEVNSRIGRTKDTLDFVERFEKARKRDAYVEVYKNRLTEQDVDDRLAAAENIDVPAALLLKDDALYKKLAGHIKMREGLVESIRNGLERDRLSREESNLGMRLIRGEDSDDIWKNLERIQKEQQQYAPALRSGYFQQSLGGAAEMGSQWARGLWRGATTYGQTLGFAAGSSAIIINASAFTNPLTAPAGLGAVAASAVTGFGMGVAIGSGMENFEREAGGAMIEYVQMKDEHGKPMDRDAARVAAVLTGAVNAGLEHFQLSRFVETLPGGERLLKTFSRPMMGKLLKIPTVREALMKIGKKYAGDIGIESIQEMAQETMTILGGVVGQWMSGQDYAALDMDEAIDRILETGAQTVGTMALSLAPGTALSAVKEVRQAKQVRKGAAQTAATLGMDVQGLEDYLNAPDSEPDAATAPTEGTQQDPYVFLPAAALESYNQENPGVLLEMGVDATPLKGTKETMLTPQQYEALKQKAPELVERLKDDVRIGAKALTNREVGDTLKKKLERPAWRTDEVVGIEKDLKEKALEAGLDQDEARKWSRLTAAWAGVTAQKTGLSPTELVKMELVRGGAEQGRGAGEAFMQTMDEDVDINQRVAVQELKTEARNTITNDDRRAMSATFGDGIVNEDTGLKLTLSTGENGAVHIAHSAFDEKDPARKQAAIAAFFNLPELVRTAKRVKITDDRKKRDTTLPLRSGAVRAIYRFLTPIRYEGKTYVLKLTAKEYATGKSEIDLNDPESIKLYDQKIVKEIKIGDTVIPQQAEGEVPTADRRPDLPSISDLSIGEMAVNVKDTLDADLPNEGAYLTREEYEAQTGKPYPFYEQTAYHGSPDERVATVARAQEVNLAYLPLARLKQLQALLENTDQNGADSILELFFTRDQLEAMGFIRSVLKDYDENNPESWPEGERKTTALDLMKRLGMIDDETSGESTDDVEMTEAEDAAWVAGQEKLEAELERLTDEEAADYEKENELWSALEEWYGGVSLGAAERARDLAGFLETLGVDSLSELYDILDRAEGTDAATWSPAMRNTMARFAGYVNEYGNFIGLDEQEYAREAIAGYDSAEDLYADPGLMRDVPEMEDFYHRVVALEKALAQTTDRGERKTLLLEKRTLKKEMNQALKELEKGRDRRMEADEARNEALADKFEATWGEVYEQTQGAEAIQAEDVKAVQAIPGKSVNDFTPEENTATAKWARKFWRELGVKSPFFKAWFGDWRAKDTTPVEAVTANKTKEDMPRGVFSNSDTGWDIQVSGTIVHETRTHALRDGSYDLLGNIEEIIKNAILLDTKTDAKQKTSTKAFIHSLYSVVRNADGTSSVLKLFVDEIYMRKTESGTIRRAYQLKKISLAGINRLNAESAAPTVPTSDTVRSVSDLFAFVKEHDPQFSTKEGNGITDDQGRPLVLYHQTDAEFSVFDTRHKGSGSQDFETPFGVFLKPTNKNIGLQGKTQMPLFARITNPYRANSRETLQVQLRAAIPGYAEILNQIAENDKKYDAQLQDLEAQGDRNYEETWNTERQPETADAERLKTLTAATEQIDAEEARINQQWTAENAAAAQKGKELITAWLKENGYDGVVLENDAGSFGRTTKTYIALDPDQVKSAEKNTGAFNRGESDIYRQGTNTAPNARIRVLKDGTSLIQFFETANRSSSFHELAHHMLRLMFDLSGRKGVDPQLAADVETVLREAGVTREEFEADTSNARDGAKTRVHEFFARSFEVYIAEGKAPSAELKGVFRRLRAWMIEVYHDVVQALGIELSDEMRGVYDRMLATPEEIDAQTRIRDLAVEEAVIQEEISRAEAEARGRAEQERLGMESPDDWAFDELPQDATEAVDGWSSEWEAYANEKEHRAELRKTLQFIKDNNGLDFKGVVRVLGLEAAKDLRARFPWYFTSKNAQLEGRGLALDTLADMLGMNEEQLVTFMERLPSDKLKTPAPLVEINPDTLNALVDRLGVETTRKYLTERKKYLTALQKELQADYEVNKGDTEVKAELEATYREQKEITESIKALDATLKVEAEPEPVDIRQRGVPSQSPQNRQKTIQALSEALQNGHKTATKYINAAYREGKREGRKLEAEKAKERLQAWKDKLKARQDLKNEVVKLVKKINKMAGSETIIWDRQKDIQQLISDYDLKRRSKKTMERRADIEAYLTENPNARDLFDASDLKYLGTTTLNDMTLGELRQLKEQVTELFEQGKREYAEWQDARKKRSDAIKNELRGALSKRTSNLPKVKTHREDMKKQYKGPLGKLEKAKDWVYSVTLGPDRLFDWLDGGATNYKGAFVRHFVDTLNRQRDAALRHVFERRQWVEKGLKKLGFKMSDFARVATTLDGKKYTWDDIMEIYVGMRNDKKARAILYGNFKESSNPEGVAAHLISLLTEDHKRAAELVIEDHNRNVDRIEAELKAAFNKGMNRETDYTSIHRMEHGSPAGLVDAESVKALENGLSDAGLLRRVEDGFMQKRVEMKDENQTAIELGLFKNWHSDVSSHEHTAAMAGTARDIASALLSRDPENRQTIGKMIKERFGDEVWRSLVSFFNDSVMDDARLAHDLLDGLSGFFAKNMVITHLAGNLGTVLKQTTSIPRFLITAGPHRILASIAQFLATGPGFLNKIYELDPQMRDRKGSSLLTMIQQDPQWGKRMYQSGLDWLLAPISIMDRWVAAIGWKATYDANLKRLGHEGAVREAQRAVRLTQQPASAKDSARMWRQNGLVRLSMIFTSDAAQTFGMTAYDLVQQLRTGKLQKAFITLTALALTAILMKAAKDGLPDEDDDDEDRNWVLEAFTEEFISSIPLVGREIMVLYDNLSGKYRGTQYSAFVTPIVKIAQAVKLWTDEDSEEEEFRRATFLALEALSLTGLVPAPVTNMRRVVESLEMADEDGLAAALNMVGIRRRE